MNFIDFEQKLQAFMDENARKWFAAENSFRGKIYLVIFVLPVIFYIFSKSKCYHPYFYSITGPEKITKKNKFINKAGSGVTINLSGAAKFAIISHLDQGIVITENKMYYLLSEGLLSFKDKKGSVSLSDIRGITIDKPLLGNFVKISINNEYIGGMSIYQSNRLEDFLNKILVLLYEQFNHKI